jgi:hypothetical protein
LLLRQFYFAFLSPAPDPNTKTSGAAIEIRREDARTLDERQYAGDADFSLISAGSWRSN